MFLLINQQVFCLLMPIAINFHNDSLSMAMHGFENDESILQKHICSTQSRIIISNKRLPANVAPTTSNKIPNATKIQKDGLRK